MRDTALAHAARGWPIFPCRPRGKEPLIAGGFKAATCDPELIRAWWRRWPRANIGLATGRPSGMVVLDIDPRNGGAESLRRLPPLPRTMAARTGGGGRHVYFRAPSFEVRCRANALGPGLDIKGGGGYVLLPPSVHPSGRRYAWLPVAGPDEAAIAPLPEWLLERLVALRPSAAPAPAPVGAAAMQSGVGGGRVVGGGRDGIVGIGRRTLEFLTHGASIGEQRLRAVAAARALLSAGYSVDAAAAAVWQGLRVSPWDPAREPWRAEDAWRIVSDLAAKPAPPYYRLLQPLVRPSRYDGWADCSGEVVASRDGRQGRTINDASPDFSDKVRPFPKSQPTVAQNFSVEVGP